MNSNQQSNNTFANLCMVGACPEIRKEKKRILLRNSQNPETVVEFSKKEWEEIKKAIKKNII